MVAENLRGGRWGGVVVVLCPTRERAYPIDPASDSATPNYSPVRRVFIKISNFGREEVSFQQVRLGNIVRDTDAPPKQI